ncbi:MAG: FG-GAP-like repeat-containing protein, partial [Bacteroidota bacterium]
MKKVLLSFLIASCIILTSGRSLAQDTFTQMAQPNLTAENTQYVQLYDWNDDGNLDLFYSDLSRFGYRLGSASGTFGSFVSFGSFDSPRGFVFTDYDNDGLDDIILGTADEDRALTNLGDGTVDDNSVGVNGFTINLDVSDFNKDGFMDAISTNGQVYLNTGNSSPRFARMTFSQQNSVSIPSGFNPGDYHLADLDNDGDDDILVASRGGQNIIFETISLTGTTFNYNTLKYNSSTGDTRRLATADFDLDGNLDIVTLQRGLGHNISFGKGGLLTDEFTNWEDVTLVALPTINSRDVEIFDFNYDGLPDILISGELGEAYLLRNNGARSFSLQQSFSISNINIFDAAIGDIDGNGSPDIVFGINGTADQVWLNNLVPPTAMVSSSENDPTSSDTIQVDLSFDRMVSEPSVEDFTITNASISSILPNISNSYTLSTTDLVTSFISNRAFLTKDLNGNFVASTRSGSVYALSLFSPIGAFIQTIYSSSVQADYAGAIDDNNILYFLAEISGGFEILRFDAKSNYSPLPSIQVLGYTPVRASQLNSGMAIGPNGEIAISALVGNSSRRLLVIDSSGNVLSDTNVTDGEYHFASDGKLLNCRGLFTGSNRGARFRVYDPDNNYDKIFEVDLIITSNIVDAVAFDKDDRIYVTRESTTSVDVWQYQYNSQAMTIDSVRSTKLQNRALNVFEDRFGIVNALTFDGPTNFIEKVSSSGYQLNLLPQQSGVVTVQLEAGSVQDSLGIENPESNTFSINYINPVPSVNISTLSNGPAAAELNVTIDFSEVVTGFELADIQVANASLSDFTEVSSGQSFTVLVSPTSNGTLTIDVPAGVASDTDSNPNNAASQFSILVSLLSATFNEDLAIPCSGGTGAISYTVTGGTSPYDFQWQGTGSNGQFITDFNLFTSAVADEPYTVNIRDVNGYLITETFTLAEPDAITFTVVEENSICAGNDTGSITISAQGGTGNLEYTIDGGTNFQPSNVFTGLEAGDYDVGVRDENMCLTLPYTSIAITEPSLPGAPTATFNSSTTYSASVQIDLAAADAETNFYAVGFGQAISGGTLFEDGTQINSGDVISVKNSGNVLEF